MSRMRGGSEGLSVLDREVMRAFAGAAGGQRRVVLVTAFFRPHLGGVGSYTESLAAELARRGCAVVVLTSRLRGQAAHCQRTPEGYLLMRLDAGFLVHGRFPWLRATAANRMLVRWLDWFAPDTVAIGAHFYPICLVGAALAKRVGAVPLVVEHVSAYLTVNDPLLDAGLHVYEHGLMRALRLFPGAFYGVSEASARWLCTFGVEARGVLSNAIDPDRFIASSSGRPFRAELGAAPEQTLVVFAGRLTLEKGAGVVVQAAQAMAAWPDVRFAVAGEGPLARRMQAAAERLPNLSFLGKLDRPDLAALMQAADVMGLPSRSEGMPTALLEAGAARVAPIITRVGGVEELVPDARCGIVLDDAGAEGFCGAVLFLHEHPEVRAAMAENLNRRVQRFSWEATADALLAASDQLNGEQRG